MKFGAREQAMDNQEYPKYLRDKYALLVKSSLSLPDTIPKDYTQVSSSDLTVEVICQYLYFLVNDYPEFFLRIVDEWIVLERENEEAKLEDDSRYGTTYPSRSRLQRDLHPRIRFEHMVKKALSEARNAVKELPLEERKWYLYTEAGQRKAQSRWEVRHVEVETEDESDEEVSWRDQSPSPSPAHRPPTPVSKTTSPSKRPSDVNDESKGPKRSRTDITPSPLPFRSRYTTSEIFGSASTRTQGIIAMGISPLPTFPEFDFSKSPNLASPMFTPKPSLIMSSKSSTLSRNPTPHTPMQLDDNTRDEMDKVLDIDAIYEDDDWQSIPSDLGIPETSAEESSPSLNLVDLFDIDGPSVPDEDAWIPVPARPEEEQTVLALPVNPHQTFFWKCDIKFHVQWELERRMAQQRSITWDDLHVSDLAVLQGKTAEAVPKIDLVLQVGSLRASWKNDDELGNRLKISDLKAREKQISKILESQPCAGSDAARRMFTEADKEEASIRSQDGRGSYSDDPDWKYGGKLIYTVYVRPVEKVTRSRPFEEIRASIKLHLPDHIDSPTHLPFSMELRPPSMTGKSFHLARKYGSRRILNFKFADINRPQARKEMFDLFDGRRFVLAGRVYRGWSAATDKSSLVAIEVNDPIPDLSFPFGIERRDPAMPSFLEMLESSNDLHLKPGQAMAKWASRPQLLLSDSYPAMRLLPSDVEVVEDIVVAGLSGPASTEETLTDGCGLMTEAVARQIGLRLPSSHGRPCVVQMRLMGAKGLLVLMSPEQEELYAGRQVVLRRSMVKSLTSSTDTARNILEVVRCGHNMLKTSASLPSEAIIALSAQGVPQRVLIDKAKVAFEELQAQFNPNPLGTETLSDVRHRLSAGFYSSGRVGVERKKRTCGEKALSLRVAGLIHDEQDKPLLDSAEQSDIEDLSGQPAQLAERAMMVVDAGFDPRSSAYAGNLLHRHVQQQSIALTQDFRIPVGQSMSAFIVPDSLGVLGRNEIYVAFSADGPVDPTTGCPLSHLAGPVLAFRSPCKLPSDVQRFTAVYRPELRHLKDCIVMSASIIDCRQSPASFLAGGDYDGDTATVIFDPSLVDSFIQADDSFANVPAGFEEQNFEKELVKGDQFLRQLAGADEESLIRNYQAFLLGAVMDDRMTGLYSIMHDNAVYMLGHEHPETVRLARMFCLVLDARKSGLRVKPEIFQKDRRRYMGKLGWRAHKKGDPDEGEPLIRRPNRLEKFIMDELMNANSAASDTIMGTFPKEVPSNHSDYDHLSAFYFAKVRQIQDFGDISITLEGQLEILVKHVTTCFDIWEQVRVNMISRDHTIQELYCLRIEGADLPGGSRTAFNQSPTKRGVARPENLAKASNMRDLAKLWHEGICVKDVPGLCVDMHEVKRLMISCSATIPKYKPRQIFPFDMDFPTTLQLKAEKVGQPLTITSDAMMAKKPTWRADRT